MIEADQKILFIFYVYANHIWTYIWMYGHLNFFPPYHNRLL